MSVYKIESYQVASGVSSQEQPEVHTLCAPSHSVSTLMTQKTASSPAKDGMVNNLRGNSNGMIYKIGRVNGSNFSSEGGEKREGERAGRTFRG